jgi:uncharacterized membrane protein YjjB (DUF3815 family)
MDLPAIFSTSLWAALYATGLGMLLTAPVRYLIPTFLCGFIGRVVRDTCIGWNMSQNWATVIAATVVVLVAAATIRRQAVSPVVLICAVLPLGAAVAMFSLIFALLQASSSTGQALDAASLALSANLGRVFTTYLTIALGLAAGLAIVRRVRREEAVTV